MTITEILAILLGLIAIAKFIVEAVNKIRNPNIKQDTEIALIKKDIATINQTLHDIKKNHINHIESDIDFIKGELIKINTLLNK